MTAQAFKSAYEQIFADMCKALTKSGVDLKLTCTDLDQHEAAEAVCEALIALTSDLLRVAIHTATNNRRATSDYLEWLRDKSDMGEDVKFSAQYWLRKRGIRQ